MTWLWPGFLLLLGLVPLLVAVYIWILRRRRRYAVRFSSLALVRDAVVKPSPLRRHLPFAFFALGLASLTFAMARPVATIQVPAGRNTIILAMDVSRSMCATDIRPNRLVAAKEAALSFVRRQTTNSQIGVVAFAGFAELVQPPTTDAEALQDAVQNLTTGRRTAIGSAILKSLDAIAEINPRVAPSQREGSTAGATPVPEGSYQPDIIVLLTDGASNSGVWPVDAAQQAADRGIRIYTIGYGTERGALMDCGDRFFGGSFGGGPPGGGGFLGGRFMQSIDEPTLRQIASMTGGEYYEASSAGQLHNVFRELPTYLITREETQEVSVAFTALGALMAALAVLLSMLWRPLP